MGNLHMLLLLLLGMVATCCCSTCHHQERSGLLHFKRGLNDSYYHLLESWNEGSDCCSWEGITCHLRTGHVLRLDLHEIGFWLSVRNSSSQIFHGLLQLQHLEYLDLSHIDFRPLPIPSEFAMLHRLMDLSLVDCAFTGRIPNDVRNMSSLKYLDVSGIHGLEIRHLGDWIGNLRGLEKLGLSGVNLTMGGDRVVENIVASLTNLTTLDLSGSVSDWIILSPLANLTSLSHLDMSYNHFTPQPFPNWISNLTALVSLSLWDCNLQGPVPSGLLILPHLRNLYLSDNPDLKVNLSSIVHHSRKIEFLSLAVTNVGGEIPYSIGNMSLLAKLFLYDSNIEGVLPASVGNMSSLTGFDLSYNNIQGVLPSSIGYNMN